MLITDDFEVDHPIQRVWEFFEDIPGVARCLPGTQLNEEIGPDHYGGGVVISLGPVKLEFDGNAKILERNAEDRTITIDAAGAEKKGRGQAQMMVDAGLAETAGGTTIAVLKKLVEQGKIDPSETTVAYITGNGLKTTEAVASAVGEPLTIDPQLADFNAAWERAQSLQRATWDTVGV